MTERKHPTLKQYRRGFTILDHGLSVIGALCLFAVLLMFLFPVLDSWLSGKPSADFDSDDGVFDLALAIITVMFIGLGGVFVGYCARVRMNNHPSGTSPRGRFWATIYMIVCGTCTMLFLADVLLSWMDRPEITP